MRVFPATEFGAWRDSAACAGRDDIDWFPEPSTRGPRSAQADRTYRQKVNAAKAVCCGCEVRRPCLEAALATPVYFDHGIRGGTSHGQRQRMRRYS